MVSFVFELLRLHLICECEGMGSGKLFLGSNATCSAVRSGDLEILNTFLNVFQSLREITHSPKMCYMGL